MNERMRFVLRLEDGEKMAQLCREFGISRKTGYKIYDRYKECGIYGLADRIQRPYRYGKPSQFHGHHPQNFMEKGRR